MNKTADSLKTDFDQYISEFEINGLQGRYWQAPALDKKDETKLIIVIYGSHSSLERNIGLAQYLRRFGQVLMPDLPGFGGMESFYKIKKKPTLDSYASYLNDFLKLKLKKDQSFVLIGFSLGFLVATQLLQKYPAWQKELRLAVSVVGFLNGITFKFSRAQKFWFFLIAEIVKSFLGSLLFRAVFLNRWVLKNFYARASFSKSKFTGYSLKERAQLLEMEIKLWQCNDVRTWAATIEEMIKCDLTTKKVKAKLLQLSAREDNFLNNELNKINLQKVYNEVVFFDVGLSAHAPTVIAGIDEIDEMIPKGLVKALKKGIS